MIQIGYIQSDISISDVESETKMQVSEMISKMTPIKTPDDYHLS
jgi:hypothetical protein